MTESKKRETAQMLVDIKGNFFWGVEDLELFGGEEQQSSHGTGGGARTKITNAKGGVTKKV